MVVTQTGLAANLYICRLLYVYRLSDIRKQRFSLVCKYELIHIISASFLNEVKC